MVRGAIEPVLQDHPEIELEIWPYELNPRPNQRQQLSQEYVHVLKTKVQAWADRYHLKLKVPEIPKPYTDIAFFGLLQAEKEGKAWEYEKEVCRVFWAEGKDISDKEVLAQVARALDLEVEGFLRALEDPQVQEEHRRRLQQAYDYDKIPLNYVPHLELEGRRLEGIFDEERLREFLKEGQEQEE